MQIKMLSKISSILLLLTVLVGACIKYPVGKISTNIIDTSRKYTVTNYTVNGVDYTSKYAGYEAQFSGTGILTISRDGIATNGNYQQSGTNLLINNFAIEPLTGFNYNWKSDFINDERFDLTINNGNDNRQMKLLMK